MEIIIIMIIIAVLFIKIKFAYYTEVAFYVTANLDYLKKL